MQNYQIFSSCINENCSGDEFKYRKFIIEINVYLMLFIIITENTNTLNDKFIPAM